MSLAPGRDRHALSLGVTLDPADGALLPDSIVVVPSRIRVDYRLTYDQADEMLDEGVAYADEWPVGALLAAATLRRAYRAGRGSTEGTVPFPIPQGQATATREDGEGEGEGGEAGDAYRVELHVETTHNSGANATAAGGMMAGTSSDYDPYCSPISSSRLIVTEMMILGA